MRPDLWTPEGTLDPYTLSDVLLMVSVHIPPERMQRWTFLELVLAYDWAWRRYSRASDNTNREREKPWFVEQAQQEQKKLDDALFRGRMKRAQETP